MTPQTPGKTLVLVRHSKAKHDAPTDLERSLTHKGEQMADELSRALRGSLGSVDVLLVSPAARARQTARPMQERLRPEEIRVEPAIYHEGVEGVLRLLTQLDDAQGTAVVVGHEPTISMLAHVLHDSEDELSRQASFGVPTATALLLTVPGPWSALGPRGAHLEEIVTAHR